MSAEPDTIAALATPRGVSALALIRVSGPFCEKLAAAVFGKKTPPVPRRSILGDYRDISGRAVDQCLYVFFNDGASHTGEPSLEITPHGNPLVTRLILADLFARGCRAAEPGEFTRRAFLNGRIDLTRAEAVADLIHARSERALEVARKRLAGDLGRRVADWTDRLLRIIAALEAYIDFPEEDLPVEEKNAPPALARALAGEWTRAAATSDRHAALSDGVRTVILGAPNAGKSSLLNALLGEERALVSPEAGTTRDFISETVAIGPHCIRIVDTAGLRHDARSELERLGMDKTLEKAAEADFTLLVVDASAPPPALPESALARLRADNALLVLNKSDLPAHPGAPGFLPALPRVAISLLTHAGIDALRDALVPLLEHDGLAPGEDELVVNARHADALRSGADALRRADALLLRADRPVELAVAEMRVALDRLGDITGRIDNEAMLDRLFATFCIGK